MKKGQKLWTRDELILAMNLYCKLPFGKLHQSNPQIIHLAELIGRTPGSVAYKLVNLASLDPSLQKRGIKGATNASRLDKEIWDEFYNNWDELPYESEKLLASIEKKPLDQLDKTNDIDLPDGLTREQLVKTRVNQSFFRKMVLASYNHTCCITGLAQKELLVAGHIKPWSLDAENRMNPRNGIAINPLHDKAFECGWLTITPDYKIKISNHLKKQAGSSAIDEYFLKYDGKGINLPTRFLPDENFLIYHNNERFKA